MAFKNHMKFFSKAYFKEIWKILIATFMGFINDNGLKLSASLAYYTVFSIAPLLILVISVAGLFFRHDAASNAIYPQIVRFVGPQAATQIQDILKNLALSGKSFTALVVSIITLLIGASSTFVEIQDSLNIIWRVKAKPKKGWLKLIENRFLSFSLIISLAFLLLASLIVNLLLTGLSEHLLHFLPAITGLLFKAINLGITFIVIAVLFGIVFKFLPDVKIRWKDVRAGAFFTAAFFMIGQYAINVYIQYMAKSSAYGAAGSILVVLIWIYYTSAILYIGAEFTQVYAEAIGSKIEPAEYAVFVQQTEVEREVSTLPPQNPQISGHLKKK
jgi:membrane protein